MIAVMVAALKEAAGVESDNVPHSRGQWVSTESGNKILPWLCSDLINCHST